MRAPTLAAVVAASILAGSACGTIAAPVASGSACRGGPPLANVYHADRLQVLAACRTVSGTVGYVRHEADGDWHIGIRVDPAFAGMLDAGNRRLGGQLVTEIVPADEAGCTPGRPPRPPHGSYDYGICTGADLRPPAIGARVTVTGPFVFDRDHGWNEIHPVWALRGE